MMDMVVYKVTRDMHLLPQDRYRVYLHPDRPSLLINTRNVLVRGTENGVPYIELYLWPKDVHGAVAMGLEVEVRRGRICQAAKAPSKPALQLVQGGKSGAPSAQRQNMRELGGTGMRLR